MIDFKSFDEVKLIQPLLQHERSLTLKTLLQWFREPQIHHRVQKTLSVCDRGERGCWFLILQVIFSVFQVPLQCIEHDFDACGFDGGVGDQDMVPL